MKIEELFETAELKDLSGHLHNGRIFVDGRKADKVLDAVHTATDKLDDVLIWHDWSSDNVYEISIAAKTKEDAVAVLKAAKAAGAGQVHWAYKPSGEMIRHGDWRNPE